MSSSKKIQVHPFSRTLGPGPYKFIGIGRIYTSETFGAQYSGPEVEYGCGTCAHCGMAIINIYVIETLEKRRFGVGSTCVLKSSFDPKLITKVENEERLRKRKKNQERYKAKREKLKKEYNALIEANKEFLASKPHPSAFHREKSLLDYFKFCSANDYSMKHLKKRLEG